MGGFTGNRSRKRSLVPDNSVCNITPLKHRVFIRTETIGLPTVSKYREGGPTCFSRYSTRSLAVLTNAPHFRKRQDERTHTRLPARCGTELMSYVSIAARSSLTIGTGCGWE